MKTILLIGASGFIGRNIYPILIEKYNVIAPRRDELNIIDKYSVTKFFDNHKIDVIIHLAASNPQKNILDKLDTFKDDIISGYENIAIQANNVEKILYFGSGADMDKRYDMHLIKEDDFGRSYPDNPYAQAKYEITKKILNTKNIYNLRLFGCYGPTDAKTKFIRDVIDFCLDNVPIKIRQNCMFDYLYVDDLAAIIQWFIENKPIYHDYNICTGQPISLLSIAEIVAKKMGNEFPIEIVKEGWNKEYSGDNSRLLKEIGNFNFTSIFDGIEKQIKWQKEYYNEEFIYG